MIFPGRSGAPLAFDVASIGPAEKKLCWLAILVGVFLRVDRFWQPSLWLDELSTAWVATSPNWSTLWQRSMMAHQPPVYYLMVKGFLAVGRNEFLIRLPSVICGLVTIGALMVIVRLAAGTRAALYAGAACALTSRAIYHSQEARMYAPVLLLTAVSIYFFITWLQRGGRWRLAGYALSTLLIAYTHIIYTCVLLGQVAVALALYVFAKDRPPRLRPLLGAQLVVGLLLTPMLSMVRSIVKHTRAGMDSFIPRPNLPYWTDLLTHPEIVAALALAVLTIPSVWSCRKQLSNLSLAEKTLLGLGLVYFAIFPCAVALAAAGGMNMLEPRYLLLSILAPLLAGAVIVGRVSSRMLRWGLNAYIGVLIGLQLIAWQYVGIRIGNRDWRAGIAWVQEQYRPGDVVLLRSGLVEAKYLSLEDPGAREYLALPLCGFYDRAGMNVFNLPWNAEQLYSSGLMPAGVKEQVRRAPRVFYLLASPPPGSWDWRIADKWMHDSGNPSRQLEKHDFQMLEVRVYRASEETAPPEAKTNKPGSVEPL